MSTDFDPFQSRAEFEFAEFLYSEEEMSAGKIDKLMNLLAALYPNQSPPFSDHKDLYSSIDAIKQGDVPWSSFSVQYSGEDLPSMGGAEPPAWKTENYEVWFRNPLQVLENQLGNPDFKNQIDYAPKCISRNGKRRYENLMSGNWAWNQAVRLFNYIFFIILSQFSRTKLV